MTETTRIEGMTEKMSEPERNNAAAERAYDVRLYLVLDDGSGEGCFFALARDEEHAKKLARPVLVGDSEEEDLRVVTAETTKNEKTRALLKFWGAVVEEALKKHHPSVIQHEFNGIGALLHGALEAHERELAAVRVEEREVCANSLEAIASRLDTTALGAPESANLSPKLLSLAAKSGAAAIRAAANEIRVNSTGGTR